MTDGQINAAIAEACGFICLDEFQVDKDGAKFRFWDYPKNWKGANKQPWCLDFCNDLNAMHEAEATLTEDQLWIMARQIERNWEDQWYFRATARQRAEAFLRTLGKWEEAQK